MLVACCSLEEFNRYFVSVTGPGCNSNESIYLGELEYSEDKFYWRHVGPEEVCSALSRIKLQAKSVNGLSSKLINIAMPCIMPVLTHIYNWSLSYGVFPTIWKAALVIPLLKTKTPTLLQHFRPISILCCISKALERLVADQIVEYMEQRGLDPFQYAYRKGHSTQTALIKVLDNVRCAMDKRMITVVVFFDFTKAFDCVSNKILIEKLRSLNFSNSVLRWICSYLENRTQAVRELSGRNMSPFVCIHADVPQGSVLGPLLFLIYLLDLRNALQHSDYNLYADDLTIYCHCHPRDLRHAIELINEDIRDISEWANANNLRLNPSKTKAMLLGTARYLNGIKTGIIPQIVVGGEVVPFTDSVVYLGLTITNTLAWDKQVSAVIGINCDKDRAAIMLAVENYVMELKLNESRIPSAPPEESTIPSAPPEEASTSQDYNLVQNIDMTECVICFDLQCEIIFLPCGHLCCCSSCSDKVFAGCPMCRSPITQKVRVVKP
ncbi:hypothetical protein DMN91_003363 [Ooceraea biroi]|uniref:RNA-directed DNA polymerase from mobile element jockey n=1 Tax=Ooceraea biroi TaxID=2015173 RepID=A0A3L8DXR5_OOCBI|nr:hypothetical protein DMN91_003363 [Ooceraea biroi]